MSEDRNDRHRNSPFPIIVMFRNNDWEMSVLMKSFSIFAQNKTARVYLTPDIGGNQYTVEVTASPEEIMPQDETMTLGEKLTLRFEAAMRGDVPRVDLRFCTGRTDMRRPEHDNLHKDYGSRL